MPRQLTEARDVQHADVVAGRAEGDALVDDGHDVVEQPRVDALGERVAGAVGLVSLQRHPARPVSGGWG